MNHRRIAHLLRQLADEFEADETPANDAPKKRAPAPAKPVIEPTDIDKARAREELRRLGYRLRP